jgi:subtilisin family serine protease
MLSCRFGGADGVGLTLRDDGDLVVVRSCRRGARHDVSPLSRESRVARAQLSPLFGVSSSGVGIYRAPEGRSEELATVLTADPEVQFAGRGLKDEFGAPVIYTENVFVKFAEALTAAGCEDAVRAAGLEVKRVLPYATNAFFLGGPSGVGREIFERAEKLLERDEVELCHPELVREVSWNGAAPQQWHLGTTTIGGREVNAHAGVTGAWEVTRGEKVTIAVIDDGVDIDHTEFAGAGKIVAPRSISPPRSNNPRPAEGANHGTACAGVACANGSAHASGVAPDSSLLPIRLQSGIGSQDEADAFVWAVDNGADVISCSWGPVDGCWWDPEDPAHAQTVHLPDSTRLAIEYAITEGRDGKGCVVVWAAGNGNETIDNDGYASNPKVIAVGACNDRATRSSYSDYGDAVWCCFPSSHGEPSITPGIWTTDRHGTEGYNSAGHPSLGDADGYCTNSFGGTSSACPGVAGVAALVLAAEPELRWDEVKEIIRRSCDRIDEAQGEYDEYGHSPRYGFGRVNAEAAVKLASA